jgi:hypothetical protein
MTQHKTEATHAQKKKKRPDATSHTTQKMADWHGEKHESRSIRRRLAPYDKTPAAALGP